ncbi:hypothetical protein RRG08_034816 [Elysia crispata]|uniref:C-type lectin domain-containing protein n=1 Tax=Elysia crispata TaxID=231223 RepID=A0AAE1AM81_9GAST|nr:hypothetical protein RRG08_034816 [Elysia crispata]
MVPMWASIFLAILAETEPKLQAYGCLEGWTHLNDHCYVVVTMEGDASRAQGVCDDFGAHTASVWSPSEKKFILSLWQKSSEFLWLGLSVNPEGDWQWDDGSKLRAPQEVTGGTWSILDEAESELPLFGKCGVLTPSGELDFLNCTTNGTAVACKQALRKVYAWSSVNHSFPVASTRLETARMFERLLPPTLTSLPSNEHSALSQDVVSMDASCAFACYSQPFCRAFEISCRTADHCRFAMSDRGVKGTDEFGLAVRDSSYIDRSRKSNELYQHKSMDQLRDCSGSNLMIQKTKIILSLLKVSW